MAGRGHAGPHRRRIDAVPAGVVQRWAVGLLNVVLRADGKFMRRLWLLAALVLLALFGLTVTGDAVGANPTTAGDVNGVAFVVFLVPSLVCFRLGLPRRERARSHERAVGGEDEPSRTEKAARSAASSERGRRRRPPWRASY